MVACMYVISLILQAVVVNSQSPATLSVPNVIPGATATFKCSLPSLTIRTSLDIYKDNVSVYQCLNIAFTCSTPSLDTDYSDVKFTALGTMLAKGTFTVTNADQTRDGGEWTCQYGSSLISSPVTFVVSGPAILSVTNVLQGATATFECSYPSLTSPTTLNIYKDGLALYQCTDIASTCSKSSPDSDYSDVRFTDLGTALAKGTFTVANADQTRDGGEWTCKYGTSLISSSFTFAETDDSWCSSNIGSCLGRTFGVIIACILVILTMVWCCFVYQKTVHHIGYMTIENVTHDSIQLRWSMDGLPPKTPGLKAKSGEQQPKAGHEMDGTHTVTVENMAPDTIVTIYLEYTTMDGTHCKKIMTMPDHIRDMTIQQVNLDTIHLRWGMNGGHPITLGLRAICGIQHPRVCHETHGTDTVTVVKLAPDTSNTIYLEYTNKGGTHYKEKLIRTQTLKAPTGKPKGLPPLKTNRVPATYTPKPGQDVENTFTGP